MLSIVLGVLTFILILVSLFMILVVLAQKSKDGGIGAALGGGAAEAAFGAETGNVLSKSTIYSAVIFFVLAFVLYIGRIYERTHARQAADNALPTLTTPAAAAPATAAETPAAPAPGAATAPSSTAPISLPAAQTTTPPAGAAATPPPAATPAPEQTKP